VLSWVIGRGGLLGRNVEQALGQQGRIWQPRHAFTWDDARALEDEVSAASRHFALAVGSSEWQIAWCAGTGIVGSEPPDLQQETRVLSRMLASVGESLCGGGSNRGAVFLASSAGGVYAGVGTPPFREDSPVEPLAPYGWNKLEQESLARQWSTETGTSLLIGRLSNLYGPGQSVSKAQGLISQLCLRILSREPLTLYVPLDTIRDYLFAKDAGQMVADGMVRLRHEALQTSLAPAVVKILASQQPTTVSTIIAQLRWVMKRPASLIVATSPNSARQARDLRMTSSVWPELDRRPKTTLSEGIRWVLTDILERRLMANEALTGS